MATVAQPPAGPSGESLPMTRPLEAGQFGLALAAAVLLFVLWEAGKLVARRRAAT